jgi:hypothetical protein
MDDNAYYVKGVASFWFPKRPKKEPLLIILAAQVTGGLDVTPYLHIDDDSDLFRAVPSFEKWRSQCTEMRVKDLNEATADEYRRNTMADWFRDVPVDLFAVTGNKPLPETERIPYAALAEGWRAEAEKVEAALRNTGRLSVNDNPAFEYLRKHDPTGPANTCFLQALYMAAKTNLTEKTFAEREAEYLRTYAPGITFS